MEKSTYRETTLQRERRIFNELLSRLLDTIVANIFDLRPQKAVRRASYLTILFLGVIFLVCLIYYPLPLWTGHVRDVLYSILITSESPIPAQDAINSFLAFLTGVFLDPRILQYLPVMLAPYFIAQHTAAIYLADVFELEDIAVARRFVVGVALTGSDDTIRIKEGKVSEEHLESPVFLIGGPGKVLVELDSAALFERADGTPHVIGPTGTEPGGKAIIEGFERFREAIDIRNHYVELRDQNENSKAVMSRSRDGISIKATDVRLMFSVYRGDNPKSSPENPYPFSKKAVENIVYKAASQVTPQKPNPSTFKFSWVNNMIGLIRGRLGRFMSEHKLTEYLDSVGLPEFETVKQRENQIIEQMQQLSQSNDELATQKDPVQPPNFQSRYKIKNLFAQFAEDFTNQARNSGVELQWIGVGTWESPVEVVPEKHLEAWELTQTNIKADSTQAMEKIKVEEEVTKLKELILKVPIDAYHEITDEYKPAKKYGKQSPKKPIGTGQKLFMADEDEEESEGEGMNQFAEALSILKEMRDEQQIEDLEPSNPNHARDVQALLLEYRKQFQETEDFIRDKNEPVPPGIPEAIKYIENQIGHWAR